MVDPPAPAAPLSVKVALDLYCTYIPQLEGSVQSIRVAVIEDSVGLMLAGTDRVTVVVLVPTKVLPL